MNIIIKYANRKLYDKQTSQYISVKELAKQPLGSFLVLDHDSQKDITTDTLRTILLSKVDEQTKLNVTKFLVA